MAGSNREITILPDFIANQIAAGEVVQRPESVVKELVENSFDAGADSIAVLVKGAGKNLIHIVDNGSGMSRSDLSLACKRHATSKILTQEDLEEIQTFGFRGEALASISAVANVEIRTRRKEDELGWKLTAEPMKEDLIEQISMDPGTQVFVRNLFYNVPARRKFLKSDLTEFRYISDTMIKFALSKPDKRLTFYDNDALIFDVKPSSLPERIGNILGENTAGGLIEVNYESSSSSAFISGYVGQPHLAKQSRTGQYLFLNGRSIISKSLSHAVFSAFEHLLEKSANPLFIINISIDPKKFDVNVHPQKHEVKFEDERHIYSLIHKAVSEGLQRNNLAPSVAFLNSESQSPFEKLSYTTMPSQPDIMLVNKLTGEIVDRGQSYSHSNYSNRANYETQHGMQFSRHEDRIDPNFQSAYESVFTEKPSIPPAAAFSGTHSAKLWQLHKKYIFMQTDNGFTMIDQHAAHERILYEKAIKAMNREFSYSQELLFPIKIEMNPSEISTVKELESELADLGYSLSIQESEVMLTSVPLDVSKGNESESFREIVDEYINSQTIKHTNKRDSLAASFACKSAIKTGQLLSYEEMKKLIEDLYICRTPYACPHGRPVILEFSLQEFDKRFSRI